MAARYLCTARSSKPDDPDCGTSAWKLLRVNFLAPKILEVPPGLSVNMWTVVQKLVLCWTDTDILWWLRLTFRCYKNREVFGQPNRCQILSGSFESVQLITSLRYFRRIWYLLDRASPYNWRMKNQLDATYYFIVLFIGSTCVGHYCAHHQELATIMMITTLVVSFLVCCRMEVRCG